MTALISRIATWHGEHARRLDAALLPLYTATIFVSALLLFAVQPMFAKMVLPKLGGAPSVWAVSMCFFQAVLLAGYCYAHALNTFLAPRTAVVTHLAVLALAALALPIGLPLLAGDPPAGDAYLWLIGVLAAGVGLPFFAVSANAPLLQSWFGRTDHASAGDPYFLYAASNAGSLLALLAYPILLEPSLKLSTQSAVWSAGFSLLALLIAFSGLAMLSKTAAETTPARTNVAARSDRTAAPGWHTRGLWIAYSFVPSALLVAFTTHMTTDIASAPFLWVLPLAAYLLTFILVFRDPPLISNGLLFKIQPLAVALVLFSAAILGSLKYGIGLIASSLAFMVTILIAHRELYLRRPAKEWLTGFYLWMSFGGVLGGIFAALISPKLFSTVFEFPLLVVAGLLFAPTIWTSDKETQWKQAAGAVGLGTIAFLALERSVATGLVAPIDHIKLLVVVLLIAAFAALGRAPHLRLAAAASALAAIALLPDGRSATYAERSFFGVHRVLDMQEGAIRVLMHGTTIHGAERHVDTAGRPTSGLVPATYYHAAGPMAKAVGLARATVPAGRNLEAGVVGLGAGSMACHAEPGDAWRFYEIDPSVIAIAGDPRHFGFISKCQPRAPMILGDARLTLAKEPDGRFDYLLIDAFASDAIPTHLLTVEALSMFMSKLSDKGVLAMNLTNRHLDLVPVFAAGMATLSGVHGLVVRDMPANPGIDTAPSIAVLVSRDESVIAAARSWPGAGPLEAAGVEAWTDDFSDIMSALMRGARH
ncbi:MAG: spermidine synthase [Hyphomicrobium sp.]